MDRKEFLEMARMENEYNDDPFEAEVNKRTWQISAIVAGIVAAVIFVAELIFFEHYNFAVFSVFAIMLALKIIPTAIRIRSVQNTALAILSGATALLSIILYVISFIYGWL